MSMTRLLQELRSRQIHLTAQGDQLKLNAPPGSLTAEIKVQLAEHKMAILRWLRESHSADELALPVCVPDPEHRYEPFALSDMQYGFYMGDDPYMEFHVRPHYYIEKNPVALDVGRYQAAWKKALRRHQAEIVVVRADGQLEQVKDPAPLLCNVVDLGEANEQDVALSLAAIRKKMMRSQLPIDSWPWLDLRVTQWRKDGVLHSRIHYNHNNFFSDGYGTTRLLQEIDLYYDHPETELPPLSLSFRDAAKTLDELAQSSAGKVAQAYWESRLPGLPSAPSLPMMTQLDRRVRSRLQRREGFMSTEHWSQFKQHAAAYGLTPSNAVFCVYAEIMSAWGNTRHFVLSNMMTRRLNIHPEIKDILGNFASLYPLEIDFRENNRFVDRARQLQERVIQDAKHLHWGGMQVMQALNRQTGSLGTAAVPFVIGSGLFMEGFTRSDFSCLETSQVMLDHQFWEMPDGSYYYVWDLLEEFFPASLIDDMWEAHQNLLLRLAKDSSLWQTEVLPVLPEHLSVTVPAKWRSTMSVPSGLLHDDLALQARQQAVAPALIAAHDCGFDTLSYADLDVASNRLAFALHAALQSAHGEMSLVGKTIAILAHRGIALFQAVYGVLKAGAAYVPIDPHLPEDRRNYILENCRAHAVFCEAEYVDSFFWPNHLPILAIENITNDHVGKVSVLADSVWTPSYTATAKDLAYLIYTSGSTGRPKGVMIEHEGAKNTIYDVNQRFQVNPTDRLFGVSSFGFDLSVYDLFGGVAAGASLVFPDPEQSLNPAHWLDLMLQYQVTIWNSAPPLASLLVEAAELRGVSLPDLRLILMSGDWIPVELPERLRQIAPNAQIVSMGGATEASIWSIIYPIEKVDPQWRSIPYGFPMQNQSWTILDEWGRAAPVWVQGDLYIGGIGLARGYWQDQEKTDAAFVAHPMTGERIYRTGDLGRFLPDGSIEFLGRKDSQVKVSGHRIELGEIESVLMQDDAVNAAVAAVQTTSTGRTQLVAFIVLKSGWQASDVDLIALDDLLAAKLPEYMLPRAIQVIERLPLSPNGKLDRKLLPQIDSSIPRTIDRTVREPQNDTERALLSIWQKILRQPTLTVGDDFFDFGGQSFEAVRIIGAVRESLGVAISLGLIWQHRTVAEVAKQMRSDDDAKVSGYLQHMSSQVPQKLLQTLRATGRHPALFLVHPAGGHVMCYRTLAARLDRPVFAFQASGVEGDGEIFDSIEDMAQAYVELLNAHQPEGAVLLGGWSSGALIAFEMARQLRELGRVVKGVLMLDCPAPHPGSAVDAASLLTWFLEDLALQLPVKQILNHINFEQQTPLQQLQQVALALQEMDIELPIEIPQLCAIYEVFLGIVQGSKKYLGAQIDVDILLLRARQGIVSEFADHPQSMQKDWGWQAYTRGVIQTEQINASHYTMLSDASLSYAVPLVEAWLMQQSLSVQSPSNPIVETYAEST